MNDNVKKLSTWIEHCTGTVLVDCVRPIQACVKEFSHEFIMVWACVSMWLQHLQSKKGTQRLNRVSTEQEVNTEWMIARSIVCSKIQV